MGQSAGQCNTPECCIDSTDTQQVIINEKIAERQPVYNAEVRQRSNLGNNALTQDHPSLKKWNIGGGVTPPEIGFDFIFFEGGEE